MCRLLNHKVISVSDDRSSRTGSHLKRPIISWIDIMRWTGRSGTSLMNNARDRNHWGTLIHSYRLPSQSDDSEMTWHDICFNDYIKVICKSSHFIICDIHAIRCYCYVTMCTWVWFLMYLLSAILQLPSAWSQKSTFSVSVSECRMARWSEKITSKHDHIIPILTSHSKWV